MLVVAGPSAWTIQQVPSHSTSTPAPILRFVDNQNQDGSYNFGFQVRCLKIKNKRFVNLINHFQSGDGTYKLENRYSDGRTVGKYGYFDPEGVLRETSYGAEAGRGFEQKIA